MSVDTPVRSLDPTAAQVWRSARGPVLVLLVVLVAGVVLAAVGGGRQAGYLDPRAVDPSGSRALAEVLRDQGVRVDLVTRNADAADAAGPGDTLLVALPDRLLEEQAEAVRRTGADLVVVGTAAPELFRDGVSPAGDVAPGTLAPECGLAAAARAGTADTGGLAYTAAPDSGPAVGCYPEGGGYSLLRVEQAGTSVTFLGSGEALTNDRLDDEGNAALALGLLGGQDRLVWYLPALDDLPPGQARSLYELVPEGVTWALVQAGVAVLLLMLWRARRLGPVVAEPLPVVVRAAETVEGRARLYRRAGARDKAAAALRAGAVARVRTSLGVPRGADPAAVVAAVTARTGRPGAAVAALLYGAAPADDAALVRLAGELDALDREVRRP